jgi:hypothetical protein
VLAFGRLFTSEAWKLYLCGQLPVPVANGGAEPSVEHSLRERYDILSELPKASFGVAGTQSEGMIQWRVTTLLKRQEASLCGIFRKRASAVFPRRQ